MNTLQWLLDHLLHIDTYLMAFVSAHGLWTYLLVFAVIFCETGLVIFPFLPGDSLLFTLGSLAAHPQYPLNMAILLPLLISASILGNRVNYAIGRALGPHAFNPRHAWLINPKHLEKAHQFYEKHGGKTIIMARFVPIIRTFAPFIAGISTMRLRQFNLYNISSAVLWISSLLGLGYFLGSLPIVRDHFTLVIYGIIVVSLLPAVFSFLRQKCATCS